MIAFMVWRSGEWLAPSSFDLNFEYQTSKLSHIYPLPPEGNEGARPQLSTFIFKAGSFFNEVFGFSGAYLLRYGLFILSLLIFLNLYKRIYGGLGKNVFFLTIATSFFFVFKYFFWLDYLFVLPMAILLTKMVKDQRNWKIIFLLASTIIFLKLSSILIIVIFIVCMLEWRNIKSSFAPIAIALFLNLIIVFVFSGHGVLDDRASYVWENLAGLTIFVTRLLATPWVALETFDVGTQSIISVWDWVTCFKFFLFSLMVFALLKKSFWQTTLRLGSLLGGCIFALLVLRDSPTFHDFATYIGVIYLGICGLVWSFLHESSSRSKRLQVALYFIFVIDTYYWNKSFDHLEVQMNRAQLVSSLKDKIDGNEGHLHVFCRDNIGQFDFYFPGKMKYQFDLLAFENLERSTPQDIYLVPKSCQHENWLLEKGEKITGILKSHGAKSLGSVKVDKNQSYDIFSIQESK